MRTWCWSEWRVAAAETEEDAEAGTETKEAEVCLWVESVLWSRVVRTIEQRVSPSRKHRSKVDGVGSAIIR